MTLIELSEASSDVLMEINKLESVHGGTNALSTIKTQMEFIKKYAECGINPKSQLGDNTFTYAIIASREFASPAEMVIQEKLDNITILLKKLTKK